MRYLFGMATPTIRLRRWCEAQHGRVTELARACNTVKSNVSHWTSQRRVPPRKHRSVIERVTGIEAKAWDVLDPPDVTPYEAAFGGES